MRRYKIPLTGIVSLLIGLSFWSTPVNADNGPQVLTITGSTLTETIGTITISGLTVSSIDQQSTYTLPITIDDLTGSGTGWSVQITSTQFTTGGGSPRTLPTTTSTVISVSSACGTSSTCTLPTNSVTYPLTVPAASTAPTAVKLTNAAASTGMGRVVASVSVRLTIPANTYAGTYTSTVFLTVASGP